MSNGDDYFRDAELRMERLWMQFAQAPVATIVGVVSPFGASGGSAGQSEVWTLVFSFESWRVDQSPVRDSSLTLRQRMTHDELKRVMNLIAPYQVLKVRARLIEDAEVGSPQAELVELVGHAADEELEQLAAKLQLPVTIQDEQFGTLTLDRRLDRFDANVKWNGRDVRLSLEAQSANDCSLALAAARRLFADEATWGNRINQFAIAKLHGHTWLEEEDDLQLTHEEFLSLMKLTDISLSAEGQFEFWHDDGNLFWGHAIEVYGDLVNGPTGIDTPG